MKIWGELIPAGNSVLWTFLHLILPSLPFPFVFFLLAILFYQRAVGKRSRDRREIHLFWVNFGKLLVGGMAEAVGENEILILPLDVYCPDASYSGFLGR